MAAPGDNEVLLFSTLSILQIIKDAQQQHGLRHGDYQRYRAYCSRRIGRIRKSLRFTNQHKSVAKHAAKFQVKKVTLEIVTDLKYLLIPLFDAERCWAYAMQMKHEMGEDLTRKKFHLLSKLRKAIEHSANLENIARNHTQIDPPSKLEAQAYNSWMHGCYYFELKDWHKAIEAFSAAKTIYSKLSEAFPDVTQAQQYEARCTELQPQLRYCAYNIGDQSAMEELMEIRRKIGDGDDLIGSDLDRLISETRSAASNANQAQVLWCGHQVSLLSPPRVNTLYSNLMDFETQLNSTQDFEQQISLYEKLMLECRDAVQALRDENKGEIFKSRRAEGEPTGPNQILFSYLNYVRLDKTIDRYLLMIQQAKNPGDGKKAAKSQDLIRLYDMVLQNLSEIEVLPGTEMDQKFIEGVQAKIAYFQAFRCFYVAETYGSLKKWSEAVALFERTLQHIERAMQCIEKIGANELTPSHLRELEHRVNTAKYTAHANRLFADQGDTISSASVSDKPLLEDLSNFSLRDVSGGVGQLVRAPPDLTAMPCKPLFFDLSLNHVTLPQITDQSEKSTNEEQGGLGKLVKGWFWGK